MAKDRVGNKRELAAQAREDFKKARRRKTLLRRAALGVAGLAAAALAGNCVIEQRQLTSSLTTATYRAGQHRSGPIAYAEVPPIGGAHNVVWQNCGVYDAPIHNEHAVHALEHGAVWITYRPDLPADQVARLKSVASDDYLLLSPYPGLPAPIVATAWNNQIAVDTASDARIDRFIARFKNNPSTTPEFGASCAGGTSGGALSDTLGTGGSMLR